MWQDIFTMASNTGIWAVLFVSLFFIQLKDSKKREEKYQTTIASLADSFRITENIAEGVKDIRKILTETEEEENVIDSDARGERM